MMGTELLSVGIDIGTSTTSMVVSRLALENTASCFTVPRVAITGSEILYRGTIYETPQQEGNRIDADKIAALLRREYKAAGITPQMVQTGAVIITGESSRKENAALVTGAMSDLAGEFVVATAGPDLESILAAKGAGAQAYSKKHACTVANLDVGGGTTNIAIFSCGDLVTQGCWDIGERLIRVKNGRIAAISSRLSPLCKDLGISIEEGAEATEGVLRPVTDRMAAVLLEALNLAPPTDLRQLLKSAESSPMNFKGHLDGLSFSGGVADYIYHPSGDWFRHDDFGPLLADSIRSGGLGTVRPTIPAAETIRATVVGAGSYTTTVSGSTISVSQKALLPLKNIPVLVLDDALEQAATQGDSDELAAKAQWFLQESAADNLIFCLNKTKNPSYQTVCALADALAEASKVLPSGAPLLVVTRHDFAKALGQAVARRMADRPAVCIDSVFTEQGDYLDLGRPLLDGMVIPVVVKTLVFG